jgi:hypothetical protein
MERAPHNSLEGIGDAELTERIRTLSKRIIEITDSPARGMADMEIGRDPESNATETAAEQGQFIPGEEQSVDQMRLQLRDLELERDRRQKAAA